MWRVQVACNFALLELLGRRLAAAGGGGGGGWAAAGLGLAPVTLALWLLTLCVPSLHIPGWNTLQCLHPQRGFSC